MKQILLMRHAKAGWENPLLKDFDRPLTERGIKDAFAMGEFIRKSGYLPDMIISSPAKRANQTSTLCVKGASLSEELISWNREFYYGTVDDYLKAINSATENRDTIMLIGHNPLMENIAGLLLSAETNGMMKMSTATLICLECFSSRWNSIEAGTCQLKWMLTPKILKSF